jgi:hypothetical protein
MRAAICASTLLALVVVLATVPARADEYDDTAGASAGTSGSSAGASGGKKDATTVGQFHKGMAVFTVAKGGLMYEATVAGQKFKYKPL